MNQYANDFTDTVRIYYNDLKTTKPMSRAKEKRLLRQCRQGNIKARNEILESNLKFVFDMAKRYTGRGVSISDLISEGNMGLIHAITKFDESKDVKFISYAVWWIRHSMIDAIKKKNLMSSVEVEANNIYGDTYENKSSDSEDEYVSKSETSFSNSFDEKTREVYLNQSKVVQGIMDTLTKREALVINYYYGLNGNDKLNLIEIGNKMGISSERARQIKIGAIRKLRSNAMMLNDTEELFI
jgi:RNA polymerase primary sigma factor